MRCENIMSNDSIGRNISITIITVCKNVSKSIKKTADSVINQIYENIEYLIIDGQSTDDTLEVLNSYLQYKNVSVFSEKDFGIYNAMNRGIARASGDYVYFINAGDTLYNEHVITNVVSYIKNNPEAIYYGKVCLVYPNGLKIVQDYLKLEGTLQEKLLNGYMPCHQAIFAPRKLLLDHYFREQYKIRADYEWLMYSISKGNECINIPTIISYYGVTGVSGRAKYDFLFHEEEKRIISEYEQNFLHMKMTDCQKKIELSRKNSELKYEHMFRLMNQWLALKQKNINIDVYLLKKGYQNISIYGMGHIGVRLLDELKNSDIKVKYGIDQNANNLFTNLKVIFPHEVLEEVDAIIVTAITSFSEIEEYLKKRVKYSILSIEDVIYEAM